MHYSARRYLNKLYTAYFHQWCYETKMWPLIINSFLILPLITAEHCEKDKCNTKAKKPCKTFNIAEFNEDSPSIVYGEARGRFGNQFLAYMVFVQLQEQLGIQAYIDEFCQEYILAFFTPESVTLPVLSETFCNPEEFKSHLKPYDGPFKDLITDEKYRKGHLIEFYPAPEGSEKGGYRPEDHISREQEEFQKRYVKHVRKNMVFRDNMLERAQRRLRNLPKKLLGLKPKDVTYIGIHIRRTDHLKFMKKNFDADPLDEEYYNDAMEYFREEYDNCLFVVASDDIKWAKKNIDSSGNDVYFSPSDPKFFYDQGVLKDNDLSKAAYDLALLISCNHTIVSRGTFSMWIALLTPGEYMTEYGSIVPTHMQE